MAADGPLAGIDLEHGTVDTNGVSLHTVRAGPADGPLVVLLHGFPEFWYGWRRQIGPLAEAGYRVVVPTNGGTTGATNPMDWQPTTSTSWSTTLSA